MERNSPVQPPSIHPQDAENANNGILTHDALKVLQKHKQRQSDLGNYPYFKGGDSFVNPLDDKFKGTFGDLLRNNKKPTTLVLEKNGQVPSMSTQKLLEPKVSTVEAATPLTNKNIL